MADRVVSSLGGKFSKAPGPVKALILDTSFGGRRVLFLKPLTFMNLSGEAVAWAVEAYGANPEEVVVVHDDLDLPFGFLKLKAGGGHGGHNGLKSVALSLGSGDFKRLRLGIGRPPEGVDTVDHVLGRFSPEEEKELSMFLGKASDALGCLLSEGIQSAMTRFNNK